MVEDDNMPKDKKLKMRDPSGNQILFLVAISLVLMIMCQVINYLSFEISAGVFAIIFTIFYAVILLKRKGN